MEALTRRLQVSSKSILPAYEDAFYFLWKERRLPVNVDVAESKLTNAREREVWRNLWGTCCLFGDANTKAGCTGLANSGFSALSAYCSCKAIRQSGTVCR
jgi:hypothetical protein